jgi:lycopene cyclase domain-containing protein
MTYLSFHLIFTVPPILGMILLLVHWKGGRWLLHKSGPIGLLALIAVIYTTPWDNYLVYKNVWSYGPEHVLATIGFVPIEEYAFFILQTVLTGLFLLVVREWKDYDAEPILRPALKVAVPLLLVVVLGLGAACLSNASTFYLGLIVTWAVPVVLVQWLLGSKTIAKSAPYWIPVVSLSTVYLGAADRLAISAGTWSISESFTTGMYLFGLPVEEALFFLVTNIMVVWGILLFEQFRSDRSAPAAASGPLLASQDLSRIR